MISVPSRYYVWKQNTHIMMMMAVMQGFVCSDTMLAGALWRNLYTEKVIDLIHLNRAVRYVRGNVRILNLLIVCFVVNFFSSTLAG